MKQEKNQISCCYAVNNDYDIHYCRLYEIIKRIPEIGSNFHGYRITRIEQCPVERQANLPEVFRYNYFLLISPDQEIGNDRIFPVAVPKDENQGDMLR